MAPADEAELVHMVATAVAIDDRPSALRYPRGEGVGVAAAGARRGAADRQGPRPARGQQDRHPVASARGSPMPEGGRRAGGQRASGRRWPMPASPSRSTPRWCERLAREHEVLITIEEGCDRRLRPAVLQHLAWAGLLRHGLKVRPMILPDRFIDHDSPAKQTAGRPHAQEIVATALAAIGVDERSQVAKR